MKNKIKNAIMFILVLFASVIIVVSIYYNKEYPKQDFDVILFILSQGTENTSPDVINSILSTCIPQIILLLILLLIPIVRKTKSNIYIDFKFRKKSFSIQLYPIKIISQHRILYIISIFFIAILIFIKCFSIDEYIKNKSQETKIYEEYYVNARDVNIQFPDNKRNLILIIGESFENTVFSIENGGSWDYSIMPELEKLALENTSFSNTERLGGAFQTYGSDHSAAGNVAITSGTPLQTVDLLNKFSNYQGTGTYMQGVFSLGEILKEQNYNLEIIMGSYGSFGGRKEYYVTNGNYKVFDVTYAIDENKMTSDDIVWWGFEDDKLYEWSKEEISELASYDNPFNYIMLTADTHYTDGFLSTNAENKFETQYENVYAYSSKCINEFVNWIKSQDFYENTTIVILGDHLGMQSEFYEEKINNEYQRTIYNVIINPAIEASNTKNRKFTSMDMFPTILASMGIEIEGNRLGLGTNLYSDTPTLIERLGFDYFNEELKKNSEFYNKYIFGEDYYISKKNQNMLNETE